VINNYYIPQHLDEPFKILLWTVDEFLLFFVPFLLLMFLFSSPLWGSVVGAICMMIVRKIKGEQGHYFIYNVMYWYLPTMMKYKATPASHLRHLLG
jgi:conjugal transfer pilus assembly protein TraL